MVERNEFDREASEIDGSQVEGPDAEDANDADDPLHLLTRAFAAAQAPDATPELHGEDETTRASVAWVAAAFDRLQPPAVVLPAARSAAPRPVRRWRLADLRRPAAAALVLLSLALLLRSRPEGTEPGGALVPDATAGRTHSDDNDTLPRLVAVADDHIELRSGSLRLVLVTTPPVPRPLIDPPR